jgi:carbamoyl-phosphate synthase large subunit
MAIGHSFEESLGKALAGLETDAPWFAPLESVQNIPARASHQDRNAPRWDLIENPSSKRLWALADALRKGVSVEELSARCYIDRWFLGRLAFLLEGEKILRAKPWPLSAPELSSLKKRGWTDRAIAEVLTLHTSKAYREEDVRETREKAGVYGAFHSVDTCAAEFEAKTPYLYSSYFGADESRPSDKSKVMILGGGPNRIGQGIEFDYCCVHAAMSLRSMGLETIMVNSNPETVSTDFDISDKLYFEPLTPEHVLFGGQTPLKLAKALERGGLKILGTSTASIDLAEDRQKFDSIAKELKTIGLLQPPAATAFTRDEAILKARELGYPVLLRPSYVLGGKGMRIVHSEAVLKEWIDEAISVSDKHPVLIDRFLNRAIEVDVDAISDGRETFIGGLMEHIEEAGIHSGDSSCSLPSITLSTEITDKIRKYTRELARLLKVVGLMNVQYAVQGGQIFLLEVNPRASRTIPFVSKAVGKPLAKIAVQVMMGKTLHDQGIREDLDRGLTTFNVKAPVFPFHKFPGVDVLLGPEMKSTGEVMGRGRTFGAAFGKAMCAAGMPLPVKGREPGSRARTAGAWI